MNEDRKGLRDLSPLNASLTASRRGRLMGECARTVTLRASSVTLLCTGFGWARPSICAPPMQLCLPPLLLGVWRCLPKSTNPWELCHNAESHVTLGQKQQSRHGVNSNILTENLKRPLLALKVSRRSALGPFLEVSIGGEGAEWIPPCPVGSGPTWPSPPVRRGWGRVAVGRRGWIG